MTATMRPLKTTDRPAPLLPDVETGELSIDSDAAADQALRELAFLSAHKDALNAKCDQDVAKLKEQCEAAQIVEIEGWEPISYEARGQALTTALERFVMSKYPTLKQASGPRSLKLNHGKLCWQKVRDKVDFVKGGSATKTVQAIDEATQSADASGRGLIEKITKLLNAIRLFSESPIRYVGLIVTLKPSIDRTLTLRSYQAGQLSDEDLKELGLKFHAGGDQFRAKPDTYDISNREGS